MTGRHAMGARGDAARALWGVLVDPAPRATLSQQRAMILARELNTLNEVRALRASMDRRKFTWPAGQAAWLMGTARIDQRRRELRDLLRDALLVTGQVCGRRHNQNFDCGRPGCWHVSRETGSQS